MAKDLHHGRTDQFKASRTRRDDAHALFHSARWRGAMYIGGYSVECLLKASLMRKFGCLTLAELDEELKSRGLLTATSTTYTHRFEPLLQASGHLDRMRKDPKLWALFNLVNLWQPAWRYDPDESGPEEAEDFLKAVDRILAWVRANF